MEPNISTGQFDFGVVDVSSTPLKLIGSLIIDGMGGDLFVRGEVTIQDLTAFRITWSPTVGGTHTTFKEDADFNTPDKTMPVATSNLYTTAAGGTFDILLANLDAVAELNFYAADELNGASLQISGKIARPPQQK